MRTDGIRQNSTLEARYDRRDRNGPPGFMEQSLHRLGIVKGCAVGGNEDHSAVKGTAARLNEKPK